MGCTSSRALDIEDRDENQLETINQRKEENENSTLPMPIQNVIESDSNTKSHQIDTGQHNTQKDKSEATPNGSSYNSLQLSEPILNNESGNMSQSYTNSDTEDEEIIDKNSISNSFDISNEIDGEIIDKRNCQDDISSIYSEKSDEEQSLKRIPKPNNDLLMTGTITNNSINDYYLEVFGSLSQTEKLKELNTLLERFQQISETPTDTDSILSLLYCLYSVVVNEHNAFILHQFFILMMDHNSINSFLQTMYYNQTNIECILLCTRLLVFFFVNNNDKSDNICLFLKLRGIPIILILLEQYTSIDYIMSTNACELFSLLYSICQNKEFCIAFNNAGGLYTLHMYLNLFLQYHIYDILDISKQIIVDSPIEASQEIFLQEHPEVSAVSWEQYSAVKNVLYYVFYILAALSRNEKALLCLSRMNLVEPCIIIINSLISILSINTKEMDQSTDSVVITSNIQSDTNPIAISDDAMQMEKQVSYDHFSVLDHCDKHGSVTSSSMSIRFRETNDSDYNPINDGGDSSDSPRGHHQILSFSTNHTVVKINENFINDDVKEDAISNIYNILNNILVFLLSSINNQNVQFEFIENKGIETFINLISMKPNITLITNTNQIVDIISELISSNNISNNVLSAHNIEELLLDLLTLVIEDDQFISVKIQSGETITQEMYIKKILTLISWQCKTSGVSRELFNINTLLTKIDLILDQFDISVFMPCIIDCLLSLSDLNEKNLEVIALSNLIEKIFPYFNQYISDEGITVKISMIIAIYSNYYGFDSFFELSQVMVLLKTIMITYNRNIIIMQNCLLSVYYLSHLNILKQIDNTMFRMFETFVKENNQDQGVIQRFTRICQKLNTL